jgi:hypothetical protein
MREAEPLEYLRMRWPDPIVPEGEPEWLLYEISRGQDAVLRSVDLYADGRITRNSIEIEQRHGDHCPSLIDQSLDEGFGGVDLIPIERAEFEKLWALGIDKPFWFTR